MFILSMFTRSFKELKDVKCLAVTAVFIALYIVMEALISIPLGFLKINFAFLALAAIGMLYGPSVAIIAAIPCDILGASLGGHGLIFVFTLIAMFEGLVYGIFLYGYEVKKSFLQNTRIIAAQSVVVLISHLIFNSTALYLLGFAGQSSASVITFIATRVIKNVVELPVDCVLMFMLLIPVKIAYNKIILRKT